MAVVTRENIGLLNDKIVVKVVQDDYKNAFELNLKKYAKNANIPGFRKGMVPTGLVKKMYGQSIFTDEILKTVEKELTTYLTNEKLNIFAQPLPLDNSISNLDMNNPSEYNFSFEVGLKPELKIQVDKLKLTRHVVKISSEMVQEEIEKLQTRHGKMTEPETVADENNVLNVQFVETDSEGNVIEGGIQKDNSLLVKYFSKKFQKKLIGNKKDDSHIIQIGKAFEEKEGEWVISDLGLNKDDKESTDKYFKMTITKVGFVEKASLNEEFFAQVYPNKGLKTEEEFKQSVEEEIKNAWSAQTKNQLHDQIYHSLLDNTKIELPEAFLTRWLQNGGEKPKTEEEAKTEYPSFANSLKWSLISSELIEENKISVEPEELKDFAKKQMLSYMGMGSMDDAPWLEEYANRMLQDKKYIENTYVNLQTEKLFSLLEEKANIKEKEVTTEELTKMQHHHH
jgi:trigger factor